MTTGGGLAAALAAVQAELPVVPKGKTARIPGKNGAAGYSYTYADLGDVSGVVLPLLTRHGLAFSCHPRQTTGGGYELAGSLLHTSGETIEGALPLQGRTAQELGSSITYARRYLLGCLTGVVTDDDDDGTLAEQAQRATVDRRPAAAQAWAEAQRAKTTAEVGAVWRAASAEGLLDTPVEHLDGAQEPLGAALRRYGDSLAPQAQAQAASPSGGDQ